MRTVSTKQVVGMEERVECGPCETLAGVVRSKRGRDRERMGGVQSLLVCWCRASLRLVLLFVIDLISGSLRQFEAEFAEDCSVTTHNFFWG